MNPYQFEHVCDVCGEVGVTTARGNTAAWTKGGFLSHTDPRVCADSLRRQREKSAVSQTADGGEG